MIRVFKVRFNTSFPANSLYPWRVIEIKEKEWIESLTLQLSIFVFSETTEDTLPDGKIKYHLTLRAHRVHFSKQKEDGGFEKIIFH
jgi:hypothetical protein